MFSSASSKLKPTFWCSGKNKSLVETPCCWDVRREEKGEEDDPFGNWDVRSKARLSAGISCCMSWEASGASSCPSSCGFTCTAVLIATEQNVWFPSLYIIFLLQWLLHLLWSESIQFYWCAARKGVFFSVWRNSDLPAYPWPIEYYNLPHQVVLQRQYNPWERVCQPLPEYVI